MDQEEFDDTIRALSSKNLPTSPSNLEANVLRRIRLAQADADDDLWSWISALVPKTSFVVSALALVIVTSSLVTAVSTSAYTVGVERRLEASRALDFDFVQATELVSLDK